MTKFSLFLLTVVIGSITLLLAVQFGASQTIGEANKTSMMGNKTSNTTDAVAENNTITLNAAEVGENQYRWVDNSGNENPTLSIVANNEYTIKISNPTDEEHELIIDTKADGKASEIAKSGDIEPGGKNVEFNFKPDQVGELGYHCEYHPDIMKGAIKVTQND